MRIKIKEFEQLLDKAPVNDLEVRKRLRNQEQEIFDSRILSATSVEDVKMIPISSMLSIMKNIDGYCGGEFADDAEEKKEVCDYVGKVWGAPEKQEYRVL